MVCMYAIDSYNMIRVNLFKLSHSQALSQFFIFFLGGFPVTFGLADGGVRGAPCQRLFLLAYTYGKLPLSSYLDG